MSREPPGPEPSASHPHLPVWCLLLLAFSSAIGQTGVCLLGEITPASRCRNGIRKTGSNLPSLGVGAQEGPLAVLQPGLWSCWEMVGGAAHD